MGFSYYGYTTLACPSLFSARNTAIACGSWFWLCKSNTLAILEAKDKRVKKKSPKRSRRRKKVVFEPTMSFYSSVTACNSDKERCMKIPIDSHSAETVPTAKSNEKNDTKSKSRFLVLPNPFQSIAYLKEKDVATVLMYNLLQYAGFYCVIASITDLLITIYGINESQVGLYFLSCGLGASLGNLPPVLLNWRFQKIAKSLGFDGKYRHNIAPEFPLEKARMGITWIWGVAFNVAMILYGWCPHYKAHISLPILLNFICM